MTVCPLPSVGVPTESGRLPIEKNDDQSIFFFVFFGPIVVCMTMTS